MMKKLGLGTKLSSKSSTSQSSTTSSFAESILFGTRSYAPPPIPEFQRQEIPPHTLLELRLACAEIVKETGPSGAELEAILNQQDPLELYKKEEQHRKDIEKIRLQASRTHASAFPPVRGARERNRLSKSNLSSYNASSTSLISPQPVSKQPTHRPLIPAAAAKQKIQAENAEVEQQALRRAVSRKPVPDKYDVPVAKTKSHYEVRLKSADAVAGPHHSRTAASSTSTTRSNTTADNHISTNQTSFAQTPADQQRSSLPYPLRSASQSQLSSIRRPDELVSTISGVDFFSPNPDYEIPSLYHVKGGVSMPSRTRSRAGSIKDSIIGGIRDYMQPRASLDRYSRPQSRQSRSTTRDHSRTPSRASSVTRSSREWMRNAASSLRRKGSISSLISQRGDGDERGRKNDKSVDLNRSLPPLPGLDSYKEPKKHIAQLLARPRFSTKTSTDTAMEQQTSVTDDTESTPQTVSQLNLGVHSATSSKKVSPETVSSKQFPRIPFAEVGDDTIDQAQPRSGTKEKRRRNESFGRHQEDELRRVVREKIEQGKLHKNNSEAHSQGTSPKQHRPIKQNSWGMEQMEAGYIATNQANSPAPTADSAPSNSRRGFRGRFSKLLGHGSPQSSVIASH